MSKVDNNCRASLRRQTHSGCRCLKLYSVLAVILPLSDVCLCFYFFFSKTVVSWAVLALQLAVVSLSDPRNLAGYCAIRSSHRLLTDNTVVGT